MEKIVSLEDYESRKYAEGLVKRDLIKTNFCVENFFDFERLVLKGIAVSNKLS